MRKKGTGPWSRIARELKRRFLRRLLHRFHGDKAAVCNYLGISREHLETLVLTLDLMGEPIIKPRRRKRREWFGVQVSP